MSAPRSRALPVEVFAGNMTDFSPHLYHDVNQLTLGPAVVDPMASPSEPVIHGKADDEDPPFAVLEGAEQPKQETGEHQQQQQQQQQHPNAPPGSKLPNFEYVSYDRVQDLYEQKKGTLYFIPEGFEPVLVPNDTKASTVTNLLETAKQVNAPLNVPRMMPDTDVRLPSLALPCGVAGPQNKASSSNNKAKVKKPPRPPNAFILYRRAKQPTIVAKNHGITNNEVSKEIGRMWHDEPQEVRNKFQKMAEHAKAEHMKKYPEYRYRPRRPQERKRRVPPRDSPPPSRRGSTSAQLSASKLDSLSNESTPQLSSSALPQQPRRASSDGEAGSDSYPSPNVQNAVPALPLMYAPSPVNGSPPQTFDAAPLTQYYFDYAPPSYESLQAMDGMILESVDDLMMDNYHDFDVQNHLNYSPTEEDMLLNSAPYIKTDFP